VAKKHDLVVVADEVYEFLTFDGVEHLRIASLPGMFERTLTIGSAGKTFSATGMKIGWIIAPPQFISAVNHIVTLNPFCISTPNSEITAVAFDEAAKRDYFSKFRSDMQKKRDFTIQMLKEVNLTPIIPHGSFFILADITNIKEERYNRKEFEDGTSDPNTNLRDYKFARFLTKEIGVAVIPPSPFYSVPHKHLVENLTRFCFAKTDETLQKAAERLLKLKSL